MSERAERLEALTQYDVRAPGGKGAWGARLAGLRAILAVERSRRHRPNALTARAYAV